MSEEKTLWSLKPWLVIIAVVVMGDVLDDLTSFEFDFLEGYFIAMYLGVNGYFGSLPK